MQGRTALVTGASRGIGLGIAKALSAADARVAVAAREYAALKDLAASIGGLAVELDVTSVESTVRCSALMAAGRLSSLRV